MSQVQRNFSGPSLPLLTLTMTLLIASASSLTACDLYLEGPEPQPEYYLPDASGPATA